MSHIVNEFNEVVPVFNGRISNDTATRRPLTDFEEELLEEIKELKLENDQLQRMVVELEEIEWMCNDLCN